MTTEQRTLTRAQRQINRRRAYLFAPEGQSPSRDVYFLAAPNGLIKIGSALDVSLRVQEIQTMSPVPLTLVGRIPWAGERTERHLHRIFHRQRKHGEWFDLHPGEAMACIEQLTASPLTDEEIWT